MDKPSFSADSVLAANASATVPNTYNSATKQQPQPQHLLLPVLQFGPALHKSTTSVRWRIYVFPSPGRTICAGVPRRLWRFEEECVVDLEINFSLEKTSSGELSGWAINGDFDHVGALFPGQRVLSAVRSRSLRLGCGSVTSGTGPYPAESASACSGLAPFAATVEVTGLHSAPSARNTR